MSSFACCALVPTYDNPMTVQRVVAGIRPHLADILVVDDGSAAAGRAACAELAAAGLAIVEHRPRNGGKGAAVKTGLALAAQRGFTHALQIDADAQHDLSRIPAFLAAARQAPSAAVLGYPLFDASVPRRRQWARRICRWWVDLEVGGAGLVEDAMIGFRVYPLASTLRLHLPSERMDFDVEVAVRLAWAGVPILNLPVGVRRVPADEGGCSHFQLLRDTLRLAWLHSRLCSQRATQLSRRKLRLLPSSSRPL